MLSLKMSLMRGEVWSMRGSVAGRVCIVWPSEHLALPYIHLALGSDLDLMVPKPSDGYCATRSEVGSLVERGILYARRYLWSCIGATLLILVNQLKNRLVTSIYKSNCITNSSQWYLRSHLGHIGKPVWHQNLSSATHPQLIPFRLPKRNHDGKPPQPHQIVGILMVWFVSYLISGGSTVSQSY
jgi:hypothetical protein